MFQSLDSVTGEKASSPHLLLLCGTMENFWHSANVQTNTPLHVENGPMFAVE